MNEAQTRFNKIDPKLRDDQREDDQRDRSLIFFHKNLRITLFICIFAAFL